MLSLDALDETFRPSQRLTTTPDTVLHVSTAQRQVSRLASTLLVRLPWRRRSSSGALRYSMKSRTTEAPKSAATWTKSLPMKRFKNILLVYECDESTLVRAAALAKDNSAKLTILYPIKVHPGGMRSVTIGSKQVDIRKLVVGECQSQLDLVAATVQNMGVRPASKVLIGDPTLEVVRDVIEQERDLVIMTAEGVGGARSRLFGSTSRHLMRKCPVPLFVMKPSRRRHFHRILAAVDPEVTGEARDTLNTLILELGLSMSAREDAEFHVAHAWAMYGETMLRGTGEMHKDDIDRLVRQEAVRRRKLVQSLLTRHMATRCEVHLPKGEAGEVIPRLAARLGIDLLVMGTVCRTGIPGFIIGNTAEQVLDAVECSVLVVKPAGFVSPVTGLISN